MRSAHLIAASLVLAAVWGPSLTHRATVGHSCARRKATTCQIIPHAYCDEKKKTCQCLPGFQGDIGAKKCIQKPRGCSSNPCKNGGTCLEGEDGQSYHCHCTTSYTGDNCQDEDKCVSECKTCVQSCKRIADKLCR